MPNGVFPVPHFHPCPKSSPPLSLRLRTRWNRCELDHRLARGVDPASEEQLALRARQLLASRTDLAAHVDDVVERAWRPIQFTVEVPLRRAEVRACTEDLLALARRLRSHTPIDVQGCAMTYNLLTEGSGPLYLETGASLRHAVRCSRLALDPLPAPAAELERAA
jgi:hypothetical protein